jgi:hypothetical protein
VDGVLLINDWREGGRRELTAERNIAAGSHTVRVEYYEQSGLAVALFEWEDVTPATSGWQGAYWDNRTFEGEPALVRSDSVLAFDWGQGSPVDAIPSDNFSARWTRRVYLTGGTYRLHVLVDDGIRLWADNQLILDAWTDHDSARFMVDHVFAEGTHTLRVDYYERIGNARVWLWWEEAPASAYPQWKGEYWRNPNLTGTAVLVRNDRDINFDWGDGPPSPSLPDDNFAVRWTRTVPLEDSLYRFHILADDGIRLWIDDQLRYNAWRDQQAQQMTIDLDIDKGEHKIRVEYYEHTGGARVHVWWERISAPTYPDWKGQYWDNRTLTGDPVLVRNDPGVNFQWGTDAPALSLPSDNFSARWSRRITFDGGDYRFFAQADDGVRVLLDGRLLINEWHDSSGAAVYSTDVAVDGPHDITIEYYERMGSARVHVWWVRLQD